MLRKMRSVALRYGLALGAFALILLSSFALQRLVKISIDPTSLIIIVMIASAWYLGLGPGLLVAVVFEAAIDYFARPPFALKSAIIIFNRLVLFSSVVWFASSRRRAEHRLRQQREELQVTLASIGDAVIATDLNGAIKLINPVAEALTGWPAAEAVNKPLTEVFHIINEETRTPVESPFAIIKRAGQVVDIANHTTLITRDGRELPIEDSGAPIRDHAGKIIGVIIVFHDVGERRRAEQEREHLLGRERAARGAAEAADRLKDEFLATVSHELRTPLNAILGWAAMLNRGGLAAETAHNAAEIIERNARAQAEIISDILDVSRIITGKLHIDPQTVELAPIIMATVETVYPAANAKAITLTVALDDAPGFVAADPDRLQQIIWNLVANAIKFTPHGGHVEIRLTQSDAHLELRVSDDGIGISAQFLPHVFERFRQADSSTTRAHGGLGLGLAIVRHLVELHGGTVSAESAGVGQGAAFTVRLPLAKVQELPARSASNVVTALNQLGELRGGAESRLDLSGLRVLVVDDEPDTLEVLCLVLNQYGAKVCAAASSADALAAFLEWKPNVLVSDLGLPGEDGFALICKVRALTPEQGGNIPAAALTAYVREEDRLRALAAGYQTHIPKPVDPTTLAAAVASLAKRGAHS